MFNLEAFLTLFAIYLGWLWLGRNDLRVLMDHCRMRRDPKGECGSRFWTRVIATGFELGIVIVGLACIASVARHAGPSPWLWIAAIGCVAMLCYETVIIWSRRPPRADRHILDPHHTPPPHRFDTREGAP